MATIIHERTAPWTADNTTTRRGASSGQGRWRARFDSLGDLERWLQTNERNWSQTSSTKPRAGQSWDLGADWNDTLRMAHQGWPEGAELVRLAALSVMAQPSSERSAKWGWDVAGDLPDVGRFMAGRPDNMRRRKADSGAKPIVTICVNQSVSGGTPASSFKNYGAALLATIDQIEHAGRRVELWSGTAGIFGKTHLSALTRIKGADEPVDLGALAFAIAHPVFYRRVGFGIMERTPRTMERGGYGSCADFTGPTDLIDGPDDALMIDGLGHGSASRCSTVKGAVELACEQINEAAAKAGLVAEGEALAESL
jgi:hypothetical protein